MRSAARLALCTFSVMAGIGLPALALAQEEPPPGVDQASRTHTVQISETEARAARDKAAGKAYLDTASAAPLLLWVIWILPLPVCTTCISERPSPIWFQSSRLPVFSWVAVMVLSSPT